MAIEWISPNHQHKKCFWVRVSRLLKGRNDVLELCYAAISGLAHGLANVGLYT